MAWTYIERREEDRAIYSHMSNSKAKIDHPRTLDPVVLGLCEVKWARKPRLMRDQRVLARLGRLGLPCLPLDRRAAHFVHPLG